MNIIPAMQGFSRRPEMASYDGRAPPGRVISVKDKMPKRFREPNSKKLRERKRHAWVWSIAICTFVMGCVGTISSYLSDKGFYLGIFMMTTSGAVMAVAGFLELLKYIQKQNIAKASDKKTRHKNAASIRKDNSLKSPSHQHPHSKPQNSRNYFPGCTAADQVSAVSESGWYRIEEPAYFVRKEFLAPNSDHLTPGTYEEECCKRSTKNLVPVSETNCSSIGGKSCSTVKETTIKTYDELFE